MTSIVAMSSSALLHGTYTLKNIENVIKNSQDDTMMTLDVKNGDILLHGKKILWRKRAKLERISGDLALLNAIRYGSDACRQKHIKDLLNHAAHDVLHRRRPLTVRAVRALVQEIRSRQASAAQGRDFLALHTAGKILQQDVHPLLEAACRQICAVSESEAAVVPAWDLSLFRDMAQGTLTLIRSVFRSDTPEYLYRTLFFIWEKARAWAHALADVEQKTRCPRMGAALGTHIALEALRRAGMNAGFGGRFLSSRTLPEPRAFFEDLLALSRPGYCRDLHPAVVETSSAMLDHWQYLQHAVAGCCGMPRPRQFSLRVEEESRTPQLRSLAAELCRVPPEFRRVEAPAALQEEVLRHLAPLSLFDHAAREDAPYQVEKDFIKDIAREYSFVQALVPGGEPEGRVRLNFSALRREMSKQGQDAEAFGVEVVRQICDGDRKAMYALSSVLHQGACNSVLVALQSPGTGASLGLTYVPVAFSSRDSSKKIDVERLPSGDYTIATCWRTAVQMVGRPDPVSRGWLEMQDCRGTRSAFGIDIRLRLRAEDIALGICRPELDHLFLELGVVLQDE